LGPKMISAKLNTMTSSGKCPNPIIFRSPPLMVIEAVARHGLLLALRGAEQAPAAYVAVTATTARRWHGLTPRLHRHCHGTARRPLGRVDGYREPG
jgi:hypothetical protein